MRYFSFSSYSITKLKLKLERSKIRYSTELRSKSFLNYKRRCLPNNLGLKALKVCFPSIKL